MNAVDIFIPTYHADFIWLEYLLKSIRKFASGFRNVVICSDNDGHVVPEDILNIVPNTINYVDLPKQWPSKCKHRVGYFFQQYIKLNWMSYTDADAIFILDCDEMLSVKTTPETITEDGKFRWFYRKWENAGSANMWKEPTEFILKRSVDYEAMCVAGFVLERNATSLFCKYIMDTYERSSLWDAFMVSGFELFSEYNAFGNFILNIDHPAYKKYIDSSEYFPSNHSIVKSWSYAGVSPEDKERRDKILEL